MNRPQIFPFARQTAGCAPRRIAASVRRTTSIDVRWPDGKGQFMRMDGRARDLLTTPSGEAVELAAASYLLDASPVREILALKTSPAHPRTGELVGVRAGGASRTALSATLGDLRGGPLYQVLDDFAGASLVAPWAWNVWEEEDNAGAGAGAGAEAAREDHVRRALMTDVCVGFMRGSSALAEGGPVGSQTSRADVPPLPNPQDPQGWHAMPEDDAPGFRRARRIDIWRDGDLIKIDAGFQDSGRAKAAKGEKPGHARRVAIHEYRLHAEIDAASERLVAMQVLPLVLPFQECPGASVKATRMIGAPVSEFRELVLENLPKILGCTHLNDVLRALSDVPVLVGHVPK